MGGAGGSGGGSAYVLRRLGPTPDTCDTGHNGGWAIDTVLTKPADANGFGAGVAITDDASRAYVSAVDVAGGTLGAVYEYTRDPVTKTWSLPVLLHSLPKSTNFGGTMTLSQPGNNVLVVGASAEAEDGTYGSAYVFVRNTTTNSWSAPTRLRANDLIVGYNAAFGNSLSAREPTPGRFVVAVGAPSDGYRTDTLYSPGAVVVFTSEPVLPGETRVWTQAPKLTLVAGNRCCWNFVGSSVALSPAADELVTGALEPAWQGSFVVYRLVSGTWTQVQYTHIDLECGIGGYAYVGSGAAIMAVSAYNSDAVCVLQKSRVDGIWRKRSVLRPVATPKFPLVYGGYFGLGLAASTNLNLILVGMPMWWSGAGEKRGAVFTFEKTCH